MKNFDKLLIAVALVLTLCSSFQSSAQLDLPPVDDSYVHSSNPSTNYGSNTSVVTKISGDSRYAYFKFDLSAISGSIRSAIFRLNVKSVSASSSRAVYQVSDDSWMEGAINWNNKPTFGMQVAMNSITTSDDENYMEWDVTSYIQAEAGGDGLVTLCVTDPNATGTGVDFYTKEHSDKNPVMRVEATQYQIGAVQDAYVHSSNPSTNYGSIASVVTKISSDERYAYYQFDLSDYIGNMVEAKLRLNVKSVSATTSRTLFAVSDDSWSESSINWNNKPAYTSALSTAPITTSDDEQYIEWNITSYVRAQMAGDELVSIAVSDPRSTGTGVDFYTKEQGVNKVPVLQLTDGTASGLVHPGGLFVQNDMDRMRNFVAAGTEPHTTSYNQLVQENKASYNYSVRGNSTMTQVARGGINGGQWESDATAAYLNAIMWVITLDTRHADKCVEIFNAWKNVTYVGGTGTYPLDAGLFVWKMVEAAEIIKTTYAGWSVADIQAFRAMLVYPGYSDVAVPSSVNSSSVGSFYWRIYNGDPGRHGNQDMIAYRGMITMAVFLDNKKMYDRALRYFTSEPGRTDDIAMPTGPSPSGSQTANNAYFTTFNYQGSTGATANYGYNGQLKYYFWENGQCQEASRDQEHVILGLGMAAMIAQVAYNQGDDIWDLFDNRLLKAFEFGARYNTSYLKSYPDQLSPWNPTYGNGEFIQRMDRTGRWRSKGINPYFENNFTNISRGKFPGKRPVFELAYAHFERMGKGSEAVWTKRARDLAIDSVGYEKTGFSLDSPGWGALCFRRTGTNGSRTIADEQVVLETMQDQFFYPNPASNQITLQLKEYPKGNTLKVYDFAGKLVRSESLVGQTNQINVNSFLPGIYVLEVSRDGKVTYRSRLVIK